MIIKPCKTTPRKCQLILGNGSERGDYINCDDVQQECGFVHNGIQLMNTFYPNDPNWNSQRKISETSPKKDATYAWDHEYDDYHPFDLTIAPSLTAMKMSEITRLGSDIHFTLTIDPHLDDAQLIHAFEKFKNFGTVYLRINHESNGEWFRHNKKHTYKEVGDFFVRCHNLLRKCAPNVRTVFSLTADIFVGNQINSIVTRQKARLGDGLLGEALCVADYWSIDKYVSLNWGWPYSFPADSNQYFKGSVDTWWRLIEECYLLMIWENAGQAKPLFLSEFNTDADVVGKYIQAQTIQEVYGRILASDLPWLKGICMYQYCDYGGLGLYQGNVASRRAMPALDAYKDMCRQFLHEVDTGQFDAPVDYTFEWPNLDHAKGIFIESDTNFRGFKNVFGRPIYIVKEKLWFYLRPGADILIGAKSFAIFVPPAVAEGSCSTTFFAIDIRSLIISGFSNVGVAL